MQTAVNTVTRIVPWGLACDLVQCLLPVFLTNSTVGGLPVRIQLGIKQPLLRRLLQLRNITFPTTLTLLLLLPPLLHLNYFTDLSLGTDYTTATRILNYDTDTNDNGRDRDTDWKWRWRLT